MDDVNSRAKKVSNKNEKVISTRRKQISLKHRSELNKGSLNFSTKNLSNSPSDNSNSFDSIKPKSRVVSSRYKSNLNLVAGIGDSNFNATICTAGPKNLSAGANGSSKKASPMDKNSPNPGVGVFSSTMLGGNESSIQDKFHLPELPDISRICPPTCVSKKKTLVADKNSINEEEFEPAPKVEPVTQNDIDASYLSYLTWAYLDINAEKQHQFNISDAKSQLMYLSSLVNETKEKISEEKRLIFLLDWFERVSTFYEILKNKLDIIVDFAPSWESHLKRLGNQLENQLCQIKLDNIFLAEDQLAYRERFIGALEEMFFLLIELNSALTPKNEYLCDAKEQLGKLIDEINIAKRYSVKVERTSAAAIEEASLQLTLSSMESQNPPSR